MSYECVESRTRTPGLLTPRQGHTPLSPSPLQDRWCLIAQWGQSSDFDVPGPGKVKPPCDSHPRAETGWVCSLPL